MHIVKTIYCRAHALRLRRALLLSTAITLVTGGAFAQNAQPLSWDPSANHGMSLSGGNYVSSWQGGSSTPIGPGGYVLGTAAIPPGAKEYFSASTSGFYAGSAFSIGVASPSFQGDTGDGSGGTTAPAPDVTTHWDGIVDVSGIWATNPHRANASMQDGGTILIAVDRAINKYYWKSTLTNMWNDDPSADPSKGIGGIDISSLGSAPLYPVMVDGSGTGPLSMISGGTVNDPTLAGFTSMDAAAGTTTSVVAAGLAPPSTSTSGTAATGTMAPTASTSPSGKIDSDHDGICDDGSDCSTPSAGPSNASIIASVPTVTPNSAVAGMSTIPNAAVSALLGNNNATSALSSMPGITSNGTVQTSTPQGVIPNTSSPTTVTPIDTTTSVSGPTSGQIVVNHYSPSPAQIQSFVQAEEAKVGTILTQDINTLFGSSQ